MLGIDVANKVVCFGANNETIFQGLKRNVTVQLMNNHNPYIFHCMAHQCNLVVQTFSSLFLVAKTENLFASMKTYYCKSPKRHLACIKLAKIIESKV
jgi:hypothetical protein